MEAEPRIETSLERAVAKATASVCPARLAEAIRYAVFPGGGRVRPQLCLAVARACGDPNPTLTDASAAAVELLHSASLIQDDLPCFDDSPTRRGLPALHRRFGEDIAILVGDVLIVMAFDLVSAELPAHPLAGATILQALARAAGAPAGIAAGQAWESEPTVDLAAYHHAKTAALFEAAALAGAVAADGDAGAWSEVGRLLGGAYQLADDLADAMGESAVLGKPVQQDRQNHRPNAAVSLGPSETGRKLDEMLVRAKRAIPPCTQQASIGAFLDGVGARLCPPELREKATASRAAVARG
jgi:geranylgeranyl diphosphate synthase, type II